MTPATAGALAQAASAAIARGLERVQLVVAKPCTGRRRMRALGGYNGVKILWGEVCCENADGHTVVWVDAISLLAWLAVYAGVRVEVGGDK
jgi:hypothetical protein